MVDVILGSFVWDMEKDAYNQKVHGVGFAEAAWAFLDQKLGSKLPSFIPSNHNNNAAPRGRVLRGIKIVLSKLMRDTVRMKIDYFVLVEQEIEL